MPKYDANWRADAIAEIKSAKTDNFVKLVRMSGLDPATHFRFMDLSGISFEGCELFGYNFTGCNLAQCSFRGARIVGATIRMVEIGSTTDTNIEENPFGMCADLKWTGYLRYAVGSDLFNAKLLRSILETQSKDRDFDLYRTLGQLIARERWAIETSKAHNFKEGAVFLETPLWPRMISTDKRVLLGEKHIPLAFTPRWKRSADHCLVATSARRLFEGELDRLVSLDDDDVWYARTTLERCADRCRILSAISGRNYWYSEEGDGSLTLESWSVLA